MPVDIRRVLTLTQPPRSDGERRSHGQTVQTTIPDAPAQDELIVAPDGGLDGHPHHRIGNRHEDLEEMGHAADNPAGV